MRRIDRAVEIALRLRQARAEAGELEGEIAVLVRPAPGRSSARLPSDEPVVQAGGDATARNNFGIALKNLLGGGGAPSVEENGTSPPAVQGGRHHRYLVQNNRGGAGPARVAELRDQIERGVYVPFAELRAAFAGAAKVVSQPCARELERNARKRRYRRERARAAPAEARA